MAHFFLVAICALLASSCGGGADDERAAPQTTGADTTPGRLSARPGTPTQSPDEQDGLIRIGSGDELLYVPPGAGEADGNGLVVMLHGAGGSPGEGLAPFLELADRAGLMLLAPRSKGATWDIVSGRFGPDVAAIDRLLKHVFGRYDVDPDRVAVAGFSDGAGYALSLGLTNGHLFHSVVGFSPGFISVAKEQGSPRLFISHGTQDLVLPIGRTSRGWCAAAPCCGLSRALSGVHRRPRGPREGRP
jgi:phospholipase/carboxylesterase